MPRNFYRCRIRFFTGIFFLVICPFAAAQIPSHTISWVRYQNQLQFSERLYWNNEFDNRRFVRPDAQHQFITHSRVHYRIRSWDVGAGVTLSWAYAGIAENRISHPTFEFRPVVEINREDLTGKLQVGHRLRLDNRFIEEDKLDDLNGDYAYTARLRYRLQFRFPLITREDINMLQARIADEIMINHRENFFDQNRIYASTELYLSKNFSLETGYIYIYQQRFATDQFLRRHILRISLLHRIKLYS